MKDILREQALCVKGGGERSAYVEVLLPDSAYVGGDITGPLRPEIVKAINDGKIICSLFLRTDRENE